MIPSNISQEHIMRAIHDIERSRIPKGRQSSKFQLIVDRQVFPPKYVVSLANKYTNGVELAPSKFNGGAETNSFLKNLGFNIEEISSPRHQTRRKSIHKTADREARVGLNPRAQKQDLLNLLKRRFGEVKTEASFDWLVVPGWSSMDGELTKIADALAGYRGYREFFSPGIHLNPDYFIPSQKLIIEYDERQHFTIPRAIALSNYPVGLRLGYDKSAWISACQTTRATDRGPEYRDEQRAFYDSLRDILGIRNGMTVVRIKHGDYDWSSQAAAKAIESMLTTDLHSIGFSNANVDIAEISQYYADLQKSYREWAKQFNSRDEVIQWLEEAKIDTKKINKQDRFHLLSSKWNDVTIHVLRKIASTTLKQMQSTFHSLLNNQKEPDRDRIWYLLFFIHPIRHELWYFSEPPNRDEEGHFPEGYPRRLARLLRSHRLGLKGAKRHLNEREGEAIREPYLRACSTTAFKHVHLHPTTSKWQALRINDLYGAIRRLQIDEDVLSSEEQGVAIALSQGANYGFNNWIKNYAPCAINEGPIFSLKQGKQLSECFEEIVQILQSGGVSQSVLRDVLNSYHDIEE